jgi:hypothetical protein
MINNKYNLSKPKLGMAKYLAQREISLISHLDSSPRSCGNIFSSAHKQNIPFEGNRSAMIPEQVTTFKTKPNF